MARHECQVQVHFNLIAVIICCLCLVVLGVPSGPKVKSVNVNSQRSNHYYDKEWDKFKKTYRRAYRSSAEDRMRRTIWRQRIKSIRQHNSLYAMGRMKFSLSSNTHADLTDKELRHLLGTEPPLVSFDRRKPFSEEYKDEEDYNTDSLLLDYHPSEDEDLEGTRGVITHYEVKLKRKTRPWLNMQNKAPVHEKQKRKKRPVNINKHTGEGLKEAQRPVTTKNEGESPSAANKTKLPSIVQKAHQVEDTKEEEDQGRGGKDKDEENDEGFDETDGDADLDEHNEDDGYDEDYEYDEDYGYEDVDETEKDIIQTRVTKRLGDGDPYEVVESLQNEGELSSRFQIFLEEISNNSTARHGNHKRKKKNKRRKKKEKEKQKKEKEKEKKKKNKEKEKNKKKKQKEKKKKKKQKDKEKKKKPKPKPNKKLNLFQQLNKINEKIKDFELEDIAVESDNIVQTLNQIWKKVKFLLKLAWATFGNDDDNDGDHYDDNDEDDDLYEYRDEDYEDEEVEEQEKEEPFEFDLSKDSCMPLVKDQGYCSNSWSFAAVAPMEFAYCRNKGSSQPFHLSEQQLTDCVYDNGCEGPGFYTTAWEYVKYNGGLACQDTYPLISDRSGTCGTCKGIRKSAVNVITYAGYLEDENAIMAAIKARQLVAASLYISPTNSKFFFYSKGIYDDPIGCNPVRIRSSVSHAITIVGYGSDPATKTDYWIIRNSWGKSWGLNGFMRLKRGVNFCNISQYAANVTVEIFS